MLDQRQYSDSEISAIVRFAHISGNLEGAIEAQDHKKYFGNQVTITGGRKKEIIGLTGTVAWLSRKHYGSNQWFGFETRIGIKTESGMVYTSVKNVQLNGGKE